MGHRTRNIRIDRKDVDGFGARTQEKGGKEKVIHSQPYLIGSL